MGNAEAIADRIDSVMGIGGWRKDAAFITISAVALAVSFFGVLPSGPDPAWVAVILCGVPITVDAISGLFLRHDIKADVIVFIALVAALYIGDVFTAGEVAAIMQIGGLLEDITAEKARDGIGRLLERAPVTANRIDGDAEIEISASDIRKGDTLRVRSGETVPADGRIIRGTTSVDQSVITGESVPADLTVGDGVYGGTVNMYGSFDMVATSDGTDSSIQRMARLMESADAGRSRTVGIADRWATWIVLLIMFIAVAVYLSTSDIVRTVAVLVVFCPCAFVLATPTAIVAAIGNASRHGFIVRDGGSLERLAGVRHIMFDKTGTLTRGRLNVVSVVPAEGTDEASLLSIAASAESGSEHPAGRAIVTYQAEKGGNLRGTSGYVAVPGMGVRADVGGVPAAAGNAALMSSLGIDVPSTDTYGTVVHVSYGGMYMGHIVLADTVREESVDAIKGVLALSVEPVLATGDHEVPAKAVAEEVGIGVVRSGCLPEDKISIVGQLSGDGGVCMVGDGMNDAPSLRAADVGISMGGIGSDLAIEASDIVAAEDGIGGIPCLISLSRRMMSRIRFNMAVALCINVVAVSLAAAGMLTPVAGALVHNCGSVFVVVSSALLLGTRWDTGRVDEH